MWKFTVMLLISVALCYQVEAADKNTAKRAYSQLMAAIDNAVTQSQKTLNKAVQELKSKSSELESKAKPELNKTLQPFPTVLDLIAKAKAKGVNVSKCKKNADQYSKATDNVVRNLQKYFNSQLSIAQNWINDAQNRARKLRQNFATIDKEIEKCGLNPKRCRQAKCYAYLEGKIAKDTKKVSQYIMGDVTKTVALINNLVPTLHTGFKAQVMFAGGAAAKDAMDFALCAGLPFSV